MIFKILMTTIALSLPLLIGSVYKNRSISFTYLAGSLTMWALFQITAVPAIQFRTSFTLLFWIYTGLVIIVALIGLLFRLKIGFERPALSIFLVLALLIIAYQASIYIFGMHLDEDDARWIAEANDALVKDRMLLHNPATGEYIGRFVGEMRKDTFSPWAFFIAWMAKFTGVRTAVIAHTVYPPILLGLSYCAYYHIGKQLFKGKTEQGIFLLMVSVINLFMANHYTQSTFTLTRIWQGKAVVAAVIIPTIFMLILIIQNDDSLQNWFFLVVISCSACLLSGMGIAIGLVMIIVYGGYVIVCKRWRRIPLWLLSTLPSIVFGVGYYFLKK